jgi:hypothetical protein
LREARTVLGARHSDATSAVNKLFARALEPVKKPPRSAQSPQPSVRYA